MPQGYHQEDCRALEWLADPTALASVGSSSVMNSCFLLPSPTGIWNHGVRRNRPATIQSKEDLLSKYLGIRSPLDSSSKPENVARLAEVPSLHVEGQRQCLSG